MRWAEHPAERQDAPPEKASGHRRATAQQVRDVQGVADPRRSAKHTSKQARVARRGGAT